MTPIATVRAAIAAALAGIDGIGVVHATRRDAKGPAEIKEAFQPAGGTVRAWLVSHATMVGVMETVGCAETTHGWEIEGFCAFDDGAGETVLDGLIETIRARFLSTDLGIPGLTTVTDAQAGVAVIDRSPVMLGRAAGVLCAHATLRLITRIDD